MSDLELLEIEKDATELVKHPEDIDDRLCFDSEDKEECLIVLTGISTLGL